MHVSPVGTAEAKQSPPVILRWNWWALAPLALVAAAASVPFFLNHGFLATGLALQRGFALVCHQRPERSFIIFGGTIAVCSRCLGIYLGAVCGLLFRTSRSVALRLLIVAVALNLLDAASEVAGLHGNWLGVRFALGLVLGTAAGLVVLSAMTTRSRLAARIQQSEATNP